MQSPLLHIVQTELGQARIEQLIDALGENDVVVLVQKQTRLIVALHAVPCGPVYGLYDGDSSEVPALQCIEYAEFVELIAQCAQSRTW